MGSQLTFPAALNENILRVDREKGSWVLNLKARAQAKKPKPGQQVTKKALESNVKLLWDKLKLVLATIEDQPKTKKELQKIQALIKYATQCKKALKTKKIAKKYIEGIESTIRTLKKRIQEVAKPNLAPASAKRVRDLFLPKSKAKDAFLKILNTLSPKDMREAMYQLIFEDPEFAKEILEDKTQKWTAVDDKDGYHWVDTRHVVKMQEDAVFASCIELLANNPALKKRAFSEQEIKPFIQADLPQSTCAMIKTFANYQKQWDKYEYFEEAIRWDSVRTFKMMLGLWGADKRTFVELAASERSYGYYSDDDPQMQGVDVKCAIEVCAKRRAPRCLEHLVTHYPIEEAQKEAIAKDAIQNGYGEVLLAVCKNDLKEAAGFLKMEFAPYLKREQSLFERIQWGSKETREQALSDSIWKLFRFTPIDKVQALVGEYQKSLKKDELETFQAIYTKAKAEFLALAPFLSRYTNPRDVQSLLVHYYGHEQSDRPYKDLDPYEPSLDKTHAKESREQVARLNEMLNTNRSLMPTTEPFLKLLATSKCKKGTVAALVELISKERHKQVKWNVDSVQGKQFQSLRKNGAPVGYIRGTLLVGRYAHAAPFINCVYNLSDAPDLVRGPKGYKLMYNGKVLNEVKLHSDQSYIEWDHGMADLEDTWPAIEDLFEKILAMDLSKPDEKKATPKEKEKYKAKLTDFYEKAAEFVWLIGNTTPLERGSGSVAERLFGVLHMFHGLEPPTLKTHFPQLDVLDITFPLSDYKRLFPYFFEPSTIPEHLRAAPTKGGTLGEEIEAYYKRIQITP